MYKCGEWLQIYLFFYFSRARIHRSMKRRSTPVLRIPRILEQSREAIRKDIGRGDNRNIRTQRCIYRVHYWINIKNGNIRRNVNSEICGDKWLYHTSILAKRPKTSPRHARAANDTREENREKKEKNREIMNDISQSNIEYFNAYLWHFVFASSRLHDDKLISKYHSTCTLSLALSLSFSLSSRKFIAHIHTHTKMHTYVPGIRKHASMHTHTRAN